MTETRTVANGFMARLRADAPQNGLALLVILALLGVLVRAEQLSFISGDYTLYISAWQQKLHQQGFAGIGGTFYNYNPFYIYFLYIGTLLPFSDLFVVHLFSFLFDVFLAVGIARVITHARRNLFQGILGAVIGMLVLPEVWLNSGSWAQVDAAYVGLLIWALLFFMKKRAGLGWLFFGLAFAFKAQAVFLLPVLVILFIVLKHKWWTPLFAVLAAVLADLPALLAGRSASSLLGIYFAQADSQKDLSANAPNLYLLFDNSMYELIRPIGLAIAALLTLTVVALCVRFARQKRVGFDFTLPVNILRVATLFAILIPSVLPQMHERYFYLAGVLAFMVALLDRRFLVPAILIQIANVFAYVPFLFGLSPGQFPYLPGFGWLPTLGVPFELLALMLIARTTFMKDANPGGLLDRKKPVPAAG